MIDWIRQAHAVKLDGLSLAHVLFLFVCFLAWLLAWYWRGK